MISYTVFCLLIAAKTNAATMSLSDGWNLVSSRIEITVSDTFSDSSKFTSIWIWQNNNWAVYLPGENTQTYAESKGFAVLSIIIPGEGFWVNSLGNQNIFITGTESSDDTISLLSGWNLKGLVTDYSISVAYIFSDSSKFKSIWKWADNNWAVFLPGQDTSTYATSKGFSELSTINPGDGFWVNYEGSETPYVP